MKPIRGIVFDFDGTLANSFVDGMRAWEHAFITIGEAVPAYDEVKQYFGAGADRILQKVLKDDRKAQVAFDAYCKYQREHATRVEWHDEIEELLEHVARERIPTGIVTGRHSLDLDIVTEQLRVRETFPAVICDDHLNESKPSPEGILLAARKLGLSPFELFYVGDSNGDMLAARAAGAVSIAALWDPSARHTHFEAQPDLWADRPMQVWDHFLARRGE